MKFSKDDNVFKPFTVTIESEQEAAVLINVLASYSCLSMEKMENNNYYSDRVRRYYNMSGADINVIYHKLLNELKIRVG